LLIAMASGFVLAGTATGRRTDSAFPRYVTSHGYKAIVYSVQPMPQLARLPEVAHGAPVQMLFYGTPGVRASAGSARVPSRYGRCPRADCGC
jgi:hypothetical protein